MAYTKIGYKDKTVITREQREQIETMLFGPYEESWRGQNGFIDNTDAAIGKRLGLPESAVSNATSSITAQHFERVTRLRNEKQYELPQHLKRKK